MACIGPTSTGVSALYAKRRRVQPYCPEAKMETNYDETLIAGLAAAEKQVQQSYRPIIAVHKWFARRPGTLFRGLALAELDNRPLAEHFFEGHDLEGVCLDPFQGGGTAMCEANRLGLSVIGYDTNPMSRWLVERELEPLDSALFETEGECIAIAVEKKVGEFYKTRCTECEGEATVKSFLWVKTHICECGRETHLFAGPLVAGRGMKRHTHDVLVCGACLEVHQFLPDEDPPTAPAAAPPTSRRGRLTPGSASADAKPALAGMVRSHPGIPSSRLSTTATDVRVSRNGVGASSREPTTTITPASPGLESALRHLTPRRTGRMTPSPMAMRAGASCAGATADGETSTTSASYSAWQPSPRR